MSPAEQATLHAACTVVDTVARQLAELDLSLGAGLDGEAKACAAKLAVTGPIAVEALRELAPFIDRMRQS
jgi:hypothetical protein